MPLSFVSSLWPDSQMCTCGSTVGRLRCNIHFLAARRQEAHVVHHHPVTKIQSQCKKNWLGMFGQRMKRVNTEKKKNLLSSSLGISEPTSEARVYFLPPSQQQNVLQMCKPRTGPQVCGAFWQCHILVTSFADGSVQVFSLESWKCLSFCAGGGRLEGCLSIPSRLSAQVLMPDILK